MTFARRDADRVPPHWRTFGARTSPLTGSPRLAGNPANALLNYLYAILEGEATIAARIVGLDPGIGLLHADQLNRDSLAADLMEPVRPLVDRYVLRLLTERSFAAADFYETRQGVCRVTPPLARELAGDVGRVGPRRGSRRRGRRAAPGARTRAAARRIPTPVSGRNRSAGRGRDAAGPGARAPGARPRLHDLRRAGGRAAADLLDGVRGRGAAAAASTRSWPRAPPPSPSCRAAGWQPEMSDERAGSASGAGPRTSSGRPASGSARTRGPRTCDCFEREMQPRLAGRAGPGAGRGDRAVRRLLPARAAGRGRAAPDVVECAQAAVTAKLAQARSRVTAGAAPAQMREARPFGQAARPRP